MHVESIGYGCLVAITHNWNPAGESGSSQEGETKESACSRSAETVGAGSFLSYSEPAAWNICYRGSSLRL